MTPTHNHDQETDTADDQGIPDELQQRDVREEILDIVRQVDDSLMPTNQKLDGTQRWLGRARIRGNFQQPLPYDIDLATHVQHLKQPIL